ncbi:MAG: MMPL family transporter [Solobacterium sp.]|jgi:predicted RND superfamily exporter protein|nr:MMPL family transporter [Solobacterium sp.]MCH4205659.1 MMPL family transporter [Solobacterium sp.]MCH4227148.1 MMPL family transporter [Solobacterium sp.]MCH4282489.1 MMPL family transporter [Solobacterium sp.]
MRKFAHFVVKFRKMILVIAVALLIPSVIGAASTKINYDILTYLPSDLDSMQGEQYLENDFDLASSAMITVENMPTAQLMDMKEKISQVDGVSDAFWISDVMDVTIPSDMLPSELHDFMFNTDNGATMLIVRFNEPGSSDLTMNAFKKIKTICSNEAYIGGLSVILQDTKSIVDQEMPYYILIAVAACIAVLWMGMKSNAVPFIFMIGLIFPIIYNFGTNIIFGQISYITEALATVLQLGVTMDYSIFLLHRYEEERRVSSTDEEAMERAIVNTGVSISASSLTTVAGFLALCTMRLTLGTDIGLVMAKGVILGVLSTVTILPALLLCMRKWVAHREHKTIIPRLRKASFFVTDHPKTVIGIFLAVIIVFGLAYPKVQQYYTLGDSLPQDMTGIVGNQKLKEDFNMNSSYFVIVNDNLKKEDVANMSKEMEDTEGVTSVLSLEKFVGAGIPEDMLPDIASDTFYANGHEMILVNSQLKAGTDEIGEQINTLNSIVKKYDSQGYITGEAPMTKDLVEIANVDFNNVNWISILAVFVIIAISFKSLSIPVLLVASIESAIVINMAIPYFTGTVLPFIASIVIGTIQLGATVDYAILMTTRFEEELANGHTKKEAAQIAAEYSSQSILASGLTFFGATVGVSLVSKMALLQSICLLIARGALISMAVIIFVLPCLLMLFEPLIRKTTRHWAEPKGMNKK